MTHLHKISGQTFEVGSLISPNDNKTYDITVITYWKDADTQGVGAPLELVGFYFGGYNEKDTDFYIDQWLFNRNKEIRVLTAAKKYLDAYYITNEDVLDEQEKDYLKQSIVECDELLYDRSWPFEIKKSTKWTQDDYYRLIEELHVDGKIDADTMDALALLVDNYKE